MSLTKKNFYDHFEGETVKNAEYNEQRAYLEKPPFYNINEVVNHINQLPRLHSFDVNDVEGARAGLLKVLNGYYRGVVYSENNSTIFWLKTVIQSYNYKISRIDLYEEEGEGFTKVSITIKQL